MSVTLSELLDERNALALRLADWRKRWDAAILAHRGTAEDSMAGLRSLDDHAIEILSRPQSAPSDLGSGKLASLSSSGSEAQ